MIPSIHYFYVKTKMLPDFQICISASLSLEDCTRGHSTITFSQNDQNLDPPPLPLNRTYSILVTPFLRTFKI